MGMLSYDQLLQNLIRQESGGKANALSPVGAAGIMQVMPGTAREIAAELGDRDLASMNDQQIQQAMMDPARGRRYGEHYLQKMLNRYGGDQAAALVAYNGGPGRADAWLKNGRNDAVIPSETRNYYRSILGDTLNGAGGSAALAGGSGADPMPSAGGQPFEGASDRQKWATWLAALGQSFRGQDNGQQMAQLQALESQGVEQNRTYQALIKRGLDPATAEWAVRDPVVMREMVQQLFAPKSKNMQIGEIFDPETGRPVKVLIDQTTGEYQTLGGVAAPDPTKVPNLQAIDIYDDQTGGKRKMSFNPQTGQMTPLGGVAAPDAPKESALDKQVAKERVDLASTAVQAATAARGMMPIVDQLDAISTADQGDLERSVGGLQGYDWYQSSVGQIGGLGSPGLNAKIKNLSAQLNADLGKVWLAGQGSASDTEREMVREAIGKLPFARNKDEFDNLLNQIKTRINRKIAEGEQASKNVPGLDVTGGAKPKLRKITASELTEAQAAINAGVDRNKVIQRLRQNGINPAGL